MGKAIHGVLALAMLIAASAMSRADEAATEKLYGEGVHAYFANDFEAALKQFDASIAAGNRDPRCYYFRGLANWRLGNADATKADFAAGAKIEAHNPEMTTTINRSMQRVQGSTRLAIEKYRADAQLTALAERKAREAARYGAARVSAIEQLKKQADATKAAAELLPDAPAASEAAEPADAKPATPDPFADESAADAPAEEMPADQTPAADAPEVETPEAEAPAAETPATETPATEETPADADDPPAIQEIPEVAPPATEEESGDLFGEEPAAP